MTLSGTSKDHSTRKKPKRIPHLRTEHLKNPTLSGGTYLYSVYKGVPPGEDPGGGGYIRTAVGIRSKKMLILACLRRTEDKIAKEISVKT